MASFPLGVGYLGAVIKNDVEVEIMDAAVESDHEHSMGDDFTWHGSPLEQIRRRIEKFKPDILGVSCIFSLAFPVVREICREVKRIDPDIFTITGGSYPTFRPEYCLSEPALDMIAQGEGELVLLDLIHNLQEGRPLSEVDGLAYKDGERAVINPKTRWIEDLDSIPFPARELLPMQTYKRKGIPHSVTVAADNFAPLITSRGCPARCIYCSSTRFWGNRYRFRSAKNVLDEIGELIERWGVREIQFEDDNMTADRKRAKAIFQGIIDRGYRIKFSFPNGLAIWTLDREIVDLMEAAGCFELTLAFESGSQEFVREVVKKPVDLEKGVAIAEYIRSKKKIRTNAFFIIGFPGETRQQIDQTLAFADRAKTDLAYFFVATPLPGTELYEIAKNRGLLREDFSFENVSYARSSYHEGVFPRGELEKKAARAFVRYNIRSFLRRPHIFFKRYIVDLLLKRPGYAFTILLRVWRRNIRTYS